MRNLVKYLLAMAVMGSGFYAAQQYRHPNGYPQNGAVAARTPTAGSLVDNGQQPRGAASPAPLPVAALADVDRVPLLGSDRTATPGRSTLADAASVAKQPTLRSDGPAEPSSSAPAAQRSGSDAKNTDSKKETEVKSKSKKQNPKKTATAKAPDKDFVPPDLAHEYRPHAERFEIVKEAKSEEQGESAHHEAVSSSTSAAPPKSQEAPPAAAPRRHRIAEGDTLPRLAEKYLGSRDRYVDLFQANADVLFDPRLIPIGVEIVIPGGTTIVAQAAATPATAGDADDRPAPRSKAAPDAP